MAQGQYMTPPGGMPMQNPEIGTIHSMLTIARIIAILVAVVALLGALFYAFVGVFTFGLGFIFAIPLFLVFLISLFVFMRIGAIRDLVNAGRLQEAKDRTLIWMILGFIFGFLITGVVLLVAYLKFDPAIRWQQQMQMGGQQPPAWGAPPAAPYAAPYAAPAPVPAAAQSSPPAPICPKCGRPATWVAQYNRWYCYTDQQYL